MKKIKITKDDIESVNNTLATMSIDEIENYKCFYTFTEDEINTAYKKAINQIRRRDRIIKLFNFFKLKI